MLVRVEGKKKNCRMPIEGLEARQLVRVAVGGVKQEGRGLILKVAGSRAVCATGRGCAPFVRAKSAILHHGAYDSVNEDADMHRSTMMRLWKGSIL